MAFIVQEFVGDNSVQLAAEDLVRQMPWGTNWGKIRVGVRFAVNATTSLGNPNPMPDINRFGICTGPEGSFSSVATDVISVFPLSLSWAYNYGGVAPYNWISVNSGSANFYSYQKVGASWFNGGNVGGYSMTASAYPTVWRSPWYYDFTKISATVLGVVAYGPTTAQLIDCTPSTFLDSMERENGPWNVSGASLTMNLTRQVRDWDSVYFSGIRNVPATVLFDMAVVRFY